jgi:hypothetical protein
MFGDWHTIRPIEGSQNTGFEELCSQIARIEKPPEAEFIRNGPPDAGVECYAVATDGPEWGWQAKYFWSLGTAQWRELDESVETALGKHPRLVRYIVCLPFDLPDARLKGKQSARDKWMLHVEKWQKAASLKGHTVDFILWGSSELTGYISRQEWSGHLLFWFDMRYFGPEWFRSMLDEAIHSAGARYNAALNVELLIADEFSVFGRYTEYYTGIYDLFRPVLKETADFCRQYESITDQNKPSIDDCKSTIRLLASDLRSLRFRPDIFPSLDGIIAKIEQAKKTTEEINLALYKFGEERRLRKDGESNASSYQSDPLQDAHYYLSRIEADLDRIDEEIKHAAKVAASAVLLVKGDAGSGKTHLLCDIAELRLKRGMPTVLLMGQQFTTHEDPWTQLIRNIGLGAMSPGDFIGALEAAAEAADCRALIMVDALNESEWRQVWQPHLAAFIARIKRSPWIGLVLSVRSSYLDAIIPKEILAEMPLIEHRGFEDREFDAVKSFFLYYKLELPSTPLLDPEFRNPLFLKILCEGLEKSGQHRIPRGIYGISSVFKLYIGALSEKIAQELRYDPHENLVHKAFDEIARELLTTHKGWLPRDRAKELCDALLPHRDYPDSLFHALVTNDLLSEGIGGFEEERTGVVYPAYERFSDHIMAKSILAGIGNAGELKTAFSPVGQWGYLFEKESYSSTGVLEALCIQLPERFSVELPSVAPSFMQRCDAGDVFGKSIIWRSKDTFSEETLDLFNELVVPQGTANTLEILLTIALVPGHAWNAYFLDRNLKRMTMPDRDAWWSIYLHQVWGAKGAIDRIIEWAEAVDSRDPIDSEVVILASIVLAWTFSSSNRFLRDRATKALVSLLSGRLDAAMKLIERFADVDDPYALERVAAVAYGVSMRSNDSAAVGTLAQYVYEIFFANGPPPVNILFRDYARGVVERGLFLGAQLDGDVTRIRPPYGSPWPDIPSEEEIKPYMPDWGKGSYDSGSLAWARYEISSSVMNEDFARYIIGTNFSDRSHSWLSLRLGETFVPPIEQLASFIYRLNDEELKAWETYKVALGDANENAAERLWLLIRSFQEPKYDDGETNSEIKEGQDNDNEHEREDAWSELKDLLGEGRSIELQNLLSEVENYRSFKRPGGFDLRIVQRYILNRVFDLGWTVERFGEFDRYHVSSHGREARKAERIGKKYQWIAYHEVLAYIADNFQYKSGYSDEPETTYNGPWQEFLRNIDPSCTLKRIEGGTPFTGHAASWWSPHKIRDWHLDETPSTWVCHLDDLPKLKSLISPSNERDGSHWYNVDGSFVWECRHAEAEDDESDYDSLMRDVWLSFNCYIIRVDDSTSLMRWAKKQRFTGRWMPDSPEYSRAFLGEYPWAPAANEMSPASGEELWIDPDRACPAPVMVTSAAYHLGASEFDCSTDREGGSINLPCPEIIAGLNLEWDGHSSAFLGKAGNIIAFDPCVIEKGPSALLLSREPLLSYLRIHGLTLWWTIVGERRNHRGMEEESFYEVEYSGACLLDVTSGNVGGFMKQFAIEVAKDETGPHASLLKTVKI